MHLPTRHAHKHAPTPLSFQTITEPDPNDYANVYRARYYVRNPRTDTAQYNYRIEVVNPVQACLSVVYFSKGVSERCGG